MRRAAVHGFTILGVGQRSERPKPEQSAEEERKVWEKALGRPLSDADAKQCSEQTLRLLITLARIEKNAQ